MRNRFGKEIKIKRVVTEIKDGCCIICGNEYKLRAICPVCDKIIHDLFNDNMYEYKDYLFGPKNRYIEREIKEIKKQFT